jgi:hypothetical protein
MKVSDWQIHNALDTNNHMIRWALKQIEIVPENLFFHGYLTGLTDERQTLIRILQSEEFHESIRG